MTEPNSNPAPVDLPDVDLTAVIPCCGCQRPAVWRWRLACRYQHPWWNVCDLHAAKVEVDAHSGRRRWTCRMHGLLLADEPVEWRPL